MFIINGKNYYAKKIEEFIEKLIKLLSEVKLVSDKIDINKLVDRIFIDQ